MYIMPVWLRLQEPRSYTGATTVHPWYVVGKSFLAVSKCEGNSHEPVHGRDRFTLLVFCTRRRIVYILNVCIDLRLNNDLVLYEETLLNFTTGMTFNENRWLKVNTI